METGRRAELEQDLGPTSCIVTQRAFEERLRGVTFHSWAEFRAAAEPALGSPSELRGSVIALDPLRIFTWLAAALMNLPIWFLVAVVGPKLGVPLVLLYGALLRLVILRCLEPSAPLAHLASLLWPLVAATVGVGGVQAAILVCEELKESSAEPRMCWLTVLVLGFLPHLGVSWMLFRPALSSYGSQPDPHRASLVVNLFVGTFLAITALWIVVTGDKDSFENGMLTKWEAAIMACGLIWAAGRLYLRPDAGASPELVSWMLNVAVVAIFIDSHFLFSDADDWVMWLFYTLIMVFFSFLAALFRRSFPFVLSALGFFIVAIRCSFEANSVALELGVPHEVAATAQLAMLGVMGFAVIALTAQAKKHEAAIYTWVREMLRLRLGGESQEVVPLEAK